MSDPRIEVVHAGYEVIPDEYLEWAGRIQDDPKLDYLAILTSQLTPGMRVLELGCGAGEPCTRLLAERFEVTGLDVSGAQLARAREHVPGAQFVEADLTTAQFRAASFEAVAAFYCLNHVPRELLADVFARAHSWLAPGGLLLASLGIGDEAAWTGEWLGTTMFFSSHPPETNRQLLGEAGFEILRDELATMVEPDGEATFQWVLCGR